MRCECWQGEHNRRLFEEARIPARYRRCDFDNFQVYPNEKLTNAVIAVRRFAEAFPNSPKGICLIGPHGIGKTHLAVAALRSALGRGCEGIFYEVSDLLRLIRSTYNPVTKTAEMDILQPLVSVQLLVLDDVGKEKTSEWVEETMTFIVNSRYNNRLTTIFTSNYEDNPDIEALDSLARAGRFPDVLAHARDVRLHRLRRRRLPAAAAQRRRRGSARANGRSWASNAAVCLPGQRVRSRAQLKHPGRGELGWSGGKAGS